MDKSKKLMIALSVLSIIALWLGFASFGKIHWYPPGGGTVP
jgi:hypothetical protein